MRVKKVRFNWFQSGSTVDSEGAGEDWDYVEVGKNGVIQIVENEPHNGQQKWNYLVILKDGGGSRIFNPNYVEYFKEQ